MSDIMPETTTPDRMTFAPGAPPHESSALPRDTAGYIDVAAYFVPLGMTDDGWERFHATGHTVSGWGEELQHGSPPSSILTRALERCKPRPGMRLTRVAVDILGAVPVGEVRTRARVDRPGKRIEMVSAELVGRAPDGTWRPVARASGWRMLTEGTPDVELACDPPVRPLVEATDELPQLKQWPGGYIAALEVRHAPATETGGPPVAWIRAGFPLVLGEETAAWSYLMNIVDVANGVGAKIDKRVWTYMNTDLTVHLHRLPRGEWIGVSADTSTGPDGVGMCAGVVYDEDGPVGRTLQTLLVRRR